MTRTGLLGGTFDPIHNGHLQLALASLKQCKLDKVYIIPAGSPPHKKKSNVSPFRDRFEMAKLVCEQYQDLICLDIESHRSQPSYTVDTIKLLVSENPEADFHFIIGYDAFLDLPSWKEYKELLDTVSFILCGREMFDCQLPNNLLKELGYVLEQGVWFHQSHKKIIELDFLPPGISSTMIRGNKLSESQLIDLIPKVVLKYIKEKKLYVSR